MRSRFAIILAVFVLIACTAWLQKEPPHSAPRGDRPEFVTVDHGAEQHVANPPREVTDPAGCQAGCSISNHPIEPLTRPNYLDLVRTYADGEGEARESALETLLFHGSQVRDWIADVGAPLLDDEDMTFLRGELSKTHIRFFLRLVDENGVVRGKIDGARVAIGEKTHLHMADTQDLQPPEVSGTVYRTGLHHLWARI